MYSDSIIHEMIKDLFPNISFGSCTKLGEGYDRIVYKLDESYVAVLPKDESVSKHHEVECRLLPELKNYVDLPIPIPIEEGIVPYTAYKIAVYNYIPGISITKSIFDSFTEDETDQFIMTFADFLNQLHSFPVDKALSLGVEEVLFAKSYLSELNYFNKNIGDYLSSTEVEGINHLYHQYLGKKDNFHFERKLTHADLGFDHILIDEATKKISGIIDFGDCEIGDPDYDLLYLSANLGTDFIKKLYTYLEMPFHKGTIEKLNFFFVANFVQDGIYHYKRRNQGDLELCLQWIREFLKTL